MTIPAEQVRQGVCVNVFLGVCLPVCVSVCVRVRACVSLVFTMEVYTPIGKHLDTCGRCSSLTVSTSRPSPWAATVILYVLRVGRSLLSERLAAICPAACSHCTRTKQPHLREGLNSVHVNSLCFPPGSVKHCTSDRIGLCAHVCQL